MAALVTVMFAIEDKDFAEGWDGKVEELKGSIEARLDEIVGDDGGAYVPSDVKVHIVNHPGV